MTETSYEQTRKNGCQFAEEFFTTVCAKKLLLEFAAMGLIDDKLSLVQVMAWCLI